MEENLPLQKVSISGPTLSSLINRFSSSPSNIEGILFGKLSLQTPSSLLDDDEVSPSQSSLTAVITAFISTSGDVTSLLRHHNHRHVIGWFSGRRRSPLRPSLREFAVSHSLSSDSSRIFLLLTTPMQDSQTLIHTHDYKVYHFVPSIMSFEATQLDVVNIGPAFRGHYGSFLPNSELPWLPCEFHGGSPMREDGKDSKKVVKDSKELESYVEEYELGGLSKLMGSDAVNYMSGVEEFYEKMLAKLDCLARQVESSSAKVFEMVSFVFSGFCVDFTVWFGNYVETSCI
ncbi:BRCA1-A complex subunit Abraxas 1 [Bienertia sinuspersici]